MGKFIDLTGQRFGRLVVVGLDSMHKNKNRGSTSYWKCICDCGNEKIISSSDLKKREKKGSNISCGCANRQNFVGMKFGKLLVDSPAKDDKYGGSMWNCLCECGNRTIVRGASLKSGDSTSCGCNIKKNFGVSAFNNLYDGYKRAASRRNFLFNLEESFFRKITQQNCFYCGAFPSQKRYNRNNNNGWYIYNGIDRIDSSRGYTEDNVVPCCGKCNTAKLAMRREEFLLWIEKVHSYSIKDKKQ